MCRLFQSPAASQGTCCFWEEPVAAPCVEQQGQESTSESLILCASSESTVLLKKREGEREESKLRSGEGEMKAMKAGWFVSSFRNQVENLRVMILGLRTPIAIRATADLMSLVQLNCGPHRHSSFLFSGVFPSPRTSGCWYSNSGRHVFLIVYLADIHVRTQKCRQLPYTFRLMVHLTQYYPHWGARDQI